MREIKFRAWDKIKKEMVNDVFWTGAHAEKWTDEDDGECLVCLPEFACEIMQFTGLYDKNGKEIYEGDIVYLAGYGNYEVVFPFTELYEAKAENDIEEIKGNIYENKNLMKKDEITLEKEI